jgi:glutamyl-tRNA reductase
MLHGTLAELHKGDADQRSQTMDTVSRLFLRSAQSGPRGTAPDKAL